MTRSKFMPEFLTGQQAAKEVGRSGATITGWATQGILPIADNDGARGRSRYRAADVVFAARSKGADVRVAEGRLSPACRAEYDEKIGDGELSADGAAGESYDEARARKQRADASLAEIRLREAKRELVAAAAVKHFCAEVGATFRERVMSVVREGSNELDSVAWRWLDSRVRTALSECADDLDNATHALLERSAAAGDAG